MVLQSLSCVTVLCIHPLLILTAPTHCCREPAVFASGARSSSLCLIVSKHGNIEARYGPSQIPSVAGNTLTCASQQSDPVHSKSTTSKVCSKRNALISRWIAVYIAWSAWAGFRLWVTWEGSLSIFGFDSFEPESARFSEVKDCMVSLFVTAMELRHQVTPPGDSWLAFFGQLISSTLTS